MTHHYSYDFVADERKVTYLFDQDGPRFHLHNTDDTIEVVDANTPQGLELTFALLRS